MIERLLLDTHIVSWLDSGDDRLRESTRALIDGCWPEQLLAVGDDPVGPKRSARAIPGDMVLNNPRAGWPRRPAPFRIKMS